MSVVQFTDIGDICQRGSVKDADVARLRRAFARESCLSANDVEALFRIQDACPVQDPAWAEFFIETVTDYIVHETEPSGYLTYEQAAWLIARISSNGRVRAKTEFDLLLSVLQKSRWAPLSLVQFALGQVRDAVVAGTGPLRAGGVLEPGRITAAEVERTRSILCAYGADGPVAITRTEAEILFAINTAVCSAESSVLADESGWSDLFIKAIASAVMAASGYAVPSRNDIFQRTTDALDRGGGPGREWGSGPGGRGPRGLFGSYRSQSPEERALQSLERQRVEIITGEPVPEVDARWLAERLGSLGPVGRNEQMLLMAFKHAGTALDAELQSVVDHHFRAA
jgi:hypothetical protein